MYQREATLFSALSDVTRLQIIAELISGKPYPIRDITSLTNISRQAVTKHLRILENAGLVKAKRQGRENHFTINPSGLIPVQSYLRTIESQWDMSLKRLQKQFE